MSTKQVCRYDLTCRDPQCRNSHSDGWRALKKYFPCDVEKTHKDLKEHPVNSGPRWMVHVPVMDGTETEKLAKVPSSDRVIIAIDPPGTILHDDAFEVKLSIADVEEEMRRSTP